MNLKKYYKYVPFIIFFVVLLIWHCKIPLMADDLTFKGIISRHPLFPLNGNSYLEYRYSSWSSRTLIEFNLGILLSLPGKIWKLLDSIVFVLIPFLITKISIDSEKLSNKKSIFYNTIGCLFVGIFIIAFYHIFEAAGWVATTINYTWPLCFALIHFYLLKEFVFKNKKLDTSKNIGVNLILILSLIEATNSEQLLLVMLGIYLAIIIYCLYKKIEIPKLIYVYLMIMILSLIYTAICPGNINRYNKTIRTVFPEYATFNLINKLDIGTTLFLNWTTTRCDIITIIFFGIMGIYGYIISQKRKIALLTFIPIIIVLAFWTMRFIGPASIVHFVALGGSVYGLLSLDSLTIQVCLTLYGLMIMSVLVFLYLVYKYRTKELGYILTCLLIIGFASVIILGFTPSLFSSGRIFFYFTFILIIISTMLIRDIDKYLEYTKK